MVASGHASTGGQGRALHSRLRPRALRGDDQLPLLVDPLLLLHTHSQARQAVPDSTGVRARQLQLQVACASFRAHWPAQDEEACHHRPPSQLLTARFTASRISSSSQPAASRRSRMSTLVLTCRGRRQRAAANWLSARCNNTHQQSIHQCMRQDEGGACKMPRQPASPAALRPAAHLVDILPTGAGAACKLDVHVIWQEPNANANVINSSRVMAISDHGELCAAPKGRALRATNEQQRKQGNASSGITFVASTASQQPQPSTKVPRSQPHPHLAISA